MLLDVKERSKKIDAIPTIQCRVNDAIFKKFSELAKHYNCTNVELMRGLIIDAIERHKGIRK